MFLKELEYPKIPKVILKPKLKESFLALNFLVGQKQKNLLNVKGEFRPRTGHEGLGGVEIELYSNFNLGASAGWVVKATPWALCARAKRPGSH
jgi:hypothetical protein